MSAFAEPPPVQSWLDPWWLAALPLGIGVGWRAIWAVSRRREEGAWWVAAAASFAPVSQLFPFLIPVADRYLYFILPGLIGGAIALGASAWANWGSRLATRASAWGISSYIGQTL